MNDIEKILKEIWDLLKRPVLFFDTETTGLDLVKDDVIQIYVIKYDGKEFTSYMSYFNTDLEITGGAYEKHNISKEFLKDYGYLEESKDLIFSLFDEDELIVCGYNHERFDIPILVENLMRCGLDKAVSILKKESLDVFSVYKIIFSSKLEAVYKRVVGKEIENAHDASADVNATADILLHLMKSNPIETFKPQKLEIIDLGGFFKIVDGSVGFNKGKWRDKKIKDLDSNEVLSYLDWIIRTDNISRHTRMISSRIKDKLT